MTGIRASPDSGRDYSRHVHHRHAKDRVLLIAFTARLLGSHRACQASATELLQNERSSGLRNLFDLSARPPRRRDLAARCLLLIVWAAFFYGLGAGAAIFVQRAPVFALLIFGTLIGFSAALLTGRD